MTGDELREKVARRLMIDRGCPCPDDLPLDAIQFGTIALNDADTIIPIVLEAAAGVARSIAHREAHADNAETAEIAAEIDDAIRNLGRTDHAE